MDNSAFTIDMLLDGLGHILFQSIAIPFGIFASDHRVLCANEPLAALHNVTPKELIGHQCFRVCHGRSEPCEGCDVETVIRTGKTQIVGKWYEFPGRDKVWGEVHYYPIRGNDGEISAVILLAFDVTDKQKKIEVLENYTKYLSDKLNHGKDKVHQVKSIDNEISFAVKLSSRENEILRLLTEGYTNVQIGAFLSISSNTVKTHVNSIFNKLGVNDRTQAAVIATRQNIV